MSFVFWILKAIVNVFRAPFVIPEEEPSKMTLHGDAQNGTLTRASLEKYLRLVNIDAEDSNGFTPLALAVKNGYPSVVKLLLQHGANVDKPVRDGRTPLYLAANAKQNRPRVVQLLLAQKPQVDASSPEWNNETPLMVAITQGRDPEVVRLLVEAGASVTKPNDRGETALSLADQTTNPAIRNAVLPKDQQGRGMAELAQLLVSLVMFALAFLDKWTGIKDLINSVIRSLYNLTNPKPVAGPTPPPGVDIADPQTPEDFKHNLNNIIQESGLEDFFPPGDPYVQEVANKAAELKKDPTNTLNSPAEMKSLSRLALYQAVLYCDDSGSMAEDNRMGRQSDLVKRITHVATRLVPDNKGIHLRFVNRDDSTANNLRADDVERRMNFVPQGWTKIGTNLRSKILQPMIYDVIDKGVLPRPYLILTITDGCPTGEDSSKFRDEIVECATTLPTKGYERTAVRFDLSQVGNDEEAINFINNFDGDNDTEDVLFRTAEHTDALFEDLRDNETKLDQWLLAKLEKPVQYTK